MLAQGWTPNVFCPAFYRPGEANQFQGDWLKSTLNCLRALLLAPVIFAKAGNIKGIALRGVNAYYQHLMVSPTLHSIAALDDDQLLALNNMQFQTYVKDGTLPGVAHGSPGAAAPGLVHVPIAGA